MVTGTRGRGVVDDDYDEPSKFGVLLAFFGLAVEAVLAAGHRLTHPRRWTRPAPRRTSWPGDATLAGVASGDPVRDPRWPGIRFYTSETQALLEIYKAAGELGCEASNWGDPDREPCLPCWIQQAARYSSPAVYAQLEPDLHPPAHAYAEEPPF